MPYLSIAADILMIAASAGAAIYCLILSRRLARLTSFDKGIGGAIAVLSAQVDEMKAALAQARQSSDGVSHHLLDQVRQAREISAELELMIAACHDFAEEAMVVQGALAPVPAPRKPAAPKPIPDYVALDMGIEPAVISAAETPGIAAVPASTDLAPAQPTFGSRRAAAGAPALLRNGQG